MRDDIIRTKIKEIEESLDLVREHFPRTYEEFSELGLVKDGIYKRVEFCIENVLDICAIINTDLALGIPESDEHILDNLTKRKILSRQLVERLKIMKGFRNILVHRYGRINDDLAYAVLNEHLEDFTGFISEITRIIERHD